MLEATIDIKMLVKKDRKRERDNKSGPVAVGQHNKKDKTQFNISKGG